MEDIDMLRQRPDDRRCFQHPALIYIHREGTLRHESQREKSPFYDEGNKNSV
jgi:hypothetical protein